MPFRQMNTECLGEQRIRKNGIRRAAGRRGIFGCGDRNDAAGEKRAAIRCRGEPWRLGDALEALSRIACAKSHQVGTPPAVM